MPRSREASIEITALRAVPEFAQGFVRDLRPRWALEELGLDYRVRLLDVMNKPGEYLAEQPFNQVPAFREKVGEGSAGEEIQLFESGAIVLHLSERSEVLLPRSPHARARAQAWLVCALNTIEPPLFGVQLIDLFHPGEEWARLRRPQAEQELCQRLDQLAAWLDGREWLEDRFTCGDLMMVSVLRQLLYTDLIGQRPPLARYVERGLSRPAFKRALQAQYDDFEGTPQVPPT